MLQNFFDRFGSLPLYQKALGFAAVAVITIIAFYYAFLASLDGEIAQMQNKIKAKRNELNESTKILFQIKEYETKLKYMEKKFEEAMALLPEKTELPSLLEKISNLAEKSGLTIEVFRPLGEVPSDFYVKVPIDLSITGSFQEMMNFFDSVGKLRRVVNIGDLNIKRISTGPAGFLNDDAKTKIKIKTIGITYRFAGKDAPPPPPPKKDEKKKEPAKNKEEKIGGH